MFDIYNYEHNDISTQKFSLISVKNLSELTSWIAGDLLDLVLFVFFIVKDIANNDIIRCSFP